MPKVVDREVESVTPGPFESMTKAADRGEFGELSPGFRLAAALIEAGNRGDDQLQDAVVDALKQIEADRFLGFSLLLALAGTALNAARIISTSKEASTLVRAFQDQTGLKI